MQVFVIVLFSEGLTVRIDEAFVITASQSEFVLHRTVSLREE